MLYNVVKKKHKMTYSAAPTPAAAADYVRSFDNSGGTYSAPPQQQQIMSDLSIIPVGCLGCFVLELTLKFIGLSWETVCKAIHSCVVGARERNAPVIRRYR
jgi:hypothetical protein